MVVAGGGGDNAVSAIGVGAVSPGDAFISLGTCRVAKCRRGAKAARFPPPLTRRCCPLGAERLGGGGRGRGG
ncbi:hypothetical protein C7D74_32140 [Klebsiella pneumoniae]|nr:hypothetical protein C7D74_32140 [Klebsiella pneumoniae]